jgi:DNA repair exonuclease SbcCD nuclease subunit
MIKRLVHFSDLHVRLFKDHELYRGILESALKEWATIQPDRIVFSGDLVHSKNSVSPELIEFVSWVLTECAKIAKTIVIIGNHDMIESNLERLDTLTPIINSLNNPNICYYKDRGVYEDENVNWCVYSLVQHNIPPDIPQNGKVNIGIFHGPINGLKTDLGYSFGDESYDISKFDGLEIVLCGDIHLRQTLYTESNIDINEETLDKYREKGWGVVNKVGDKVRIKKLIPVIQVGSTIQQNFGENITKHGYGVYDVDKDDYQSVNLPNPKPFLKFKIDSIDDIVNGTEKLVNL